MSKDGKVVTPLSLGGGVFALRSVPEDFDDILEGCDPRQRGFIITRFDRAVAYLDEHGKSATQHRQWFEHLKHQDEALYSMRIMCLYNIRVIYTFLDQKPLLLHAFSEKAGGTSKRKSYQPACEKAKNRLREFLRED